MAEQAVPVPVPVTQAKNQPPNGAGPEISMDSARWFLTISSDSVQAKVGIGSNNGIIHPLAA